MSKLYELQKIAFAANAVFSSCEKEEMSNPARAYLEMLERQLELLTDYVGDWLQESTDIELQEYQDAASADTASTFVMMMPTAHD